MDIKGFSFSAVEASIKRPGRLDLALILSETTTEVAALFTTNRVKAAPVLLDEVRVNAGKIRGIVVNSGNANACTGDKGMADAIETARLVAQGLGLPEESLLVASTGVIGQILPMDRIRGAIPALVEGCGSCGLDSVAAAIMTTDTFPKMESRRGAAAGVPYTIAGIAKGAGMIMPNMATMLAFIVTDASVDPAFLQKAFRRACELSFNSITVDGDMSTNDTALVLANGAAGNPQLAEGSEGGAEFSSLLNDLTLSLAKLIVKDGEGATKFVSVTVRGAISDEEAKRAAMAVANSSLVKTAFFGQDANWGRIFAAVGYSGAQVEQHLTELFFDDVQMVKGGLFVGGDAEARGTEILRKPEFSVIADLHLGSGSATVYTSDLSYDYVKINADYRT